MRIEYDIIDARNSSELITAVQEALDANEGWELIGGASCAMTIVDERWHEIWGQTLVRKRT